MASRAFLRLIRKFSAPQGQFRSLQSSAKGPNDKVSIIGVPLAHGQPKNGVSMGPMFLREAGIVQQLESVGCEVTDLGDLNFDQVESDAVINNMNFPGAVGSANKKVADAVSSVIGSGSTCLTLGGDHSLAIGSISGHSQANPDLVVVWVDAHADLNPPLASSSGNIHGMVLSFLLHELVENIPKTEHFSWLKPCLRAKDVVFIGLRDVDAAERYIIEKLGIQSYTMHDIDRHGIDYVMEHAMDTVNPGMKRPIHMSYDVDGLDPSVTPSTGTPVPGGLTIREGMYIAEEIAKTDQLECMDLVEVNPTLGSQSDREGTLSTACQLIATAFGKRRKGRIPAGFKLPSPLADAVKE